MMNSIWMKLFVTSLMLLGDYAYSSEFDNRFDIDIAASNNTAQSYQSAALNDDGTQWAPSPADDHAMRQRIRFVPQTIKTDIARFPETAHKYTSLNPRAPPVLDC
jgi:hypothetical protein